MIFRYFTEHHAYHRAANSHLLCGTESVDVLLDLFQHHNVFLCWR